MIKRNKVDVILPRKKERKFIMKLKKIAALAMCATILGAAAAVSVSADNSTTTVEQVELADSTGVVSTGVSEVAANCMPSIVSIVNKSVTEVSQFYSMFGNRYGNGTSETTSAGSGIIVGQNDTELLIATNNHVVEDADTLTVTFVDGESYEAQIKGADSENDLAVIAIPLSDMSSDTLSQVRIAQIGNSDDVVVGQQVVAIGNALGYGQSVTTGIVSALDRTIEVSDSDSYYSTSTTTYENLIQTDAAINGGNSGGALLNLQGQVIGINSAKATASGVEGMGYAININKAMDIINELMTKETRTKVDESESGYLGISGATISSDYYNVPKGVYVASVEEDGAAAAAGIKEDDIITAIDGTATTSIEDLKEQLLYYKAGETVEVTAYVVSEDGYGYTEQTFSVTLGERPADSTSTDSNNDNDNSDDNQSDGSDNNGYYTNPFDYFFGGEGSNDQGNNGASYAW